MSVKGGGKMFSRRLRGVDRPSGKDRRRAYNPGGLVYEDAGKRSGEERKKSKSKERLVERRKRKRFKIKEGVFSILRGPCPQLGEITDASGGGLAFRYQDEEKLWKESSELEILALDNSFRIKRLPIRGVWDFKTANKMRERGVQFGRLTYGQRSHLRFFIRNYSL
jgi:hypothetical protein